MNAFINYMLEANLGLCLFLLLYLALLKNETDFSLKRVIILCAIVISLIFPLFHISMQTQVVPALGSYIPRSWLPEMVVYGEGNPATAESTLSFDAWTLTKTAYVAGAVIALSIFAVRLFTLSRMILRTPRYTIDKFTILESPRHDYTSFSFFNFIFIGKSTTLTDEEKALIIEHERIHAKRLHSFDVMLAHSIGIVFWFNPVIWIYKKIFIHLHEYEADARAVKYRDVNDYCSLLAKVALLSADIRLASHFSSSLTLKRIEMMRKIKSKIKWWKFAVVSAAVPLFFFIVSCQDQMVKDTNASDSVIPAAIMQRYNDQKAAKPDAHWEVVEFNEQGDKMLAKLEDEYGNPVSMELFTPDNAEYKHSTLNTEPDKITFNKEWNEPNSLRTFAIIEYSNLIKKIGDVHIVVDETATPSNGLEGFYTGIAQTIKYPEQARKMGIEGKVFVEFLVLTDGSITNIKAVKGIGAGCDEAAVEAVKSSAVKWIPGKVKGVDVKQIVVLPITFKLSNGAVLNGHDKLVQLEIIEPEKKPSPGAIDELVVVGNKIQN